MNASKKFSSDPEIIPNSLPTERTLDDLRRELYESYSDDSKWQRYGVQLYLDLDVVHESLFDQVDRLRIKLLCGCIYKMIMRGEDYRTVFVSLQHVFTGYEAQIEFRELLLDPYLMMDYAIKKSRPGNFDSNFSNN